MRILSSSFVIIALCVLSPRPLLSQEKIGAERERIRGTWAVIGYEEDGKVHMYGSAASYWKFGEWDAREWLVNAEKSELFPLWRSDPTSKPRKLDLIYVDQTNHEVLVRQGVYEIDGDSLTWTLPQGFGGAPKKPTIDATSKLMLSARPARISTARGDGFARLIMTRVKDATEALAPEERKASGK